MTTTTKALELKPEVKAMSDKLLAGFTVDGKAQSATAGGDMFKSILPEGMTIEHIEAVDNLKSTFIAAGAHAFGTACVSEMKAHPKCDKLSVDIVMCGKDSVSYTVDRFKDTVNHLGGGETIRKFGVVTTTLDMKLGKNSGQLKVARNIIGELAMAAFNKK